MLAIGSRIKEARTALGLSVDDLAGVIGKNRATVYRYENGEVDIPVSVVESLAEALHTTPAYIMGWVERGPEAEDEKRGSISNIVPIATRRFPLLGDIACGVPITASEEKELYVEAGADIRADFCLRAKGDSMIGARICDGDIVFIRKQDAVDNGEIAAIIIDDEATLKRVNYFPDKNLLILKAENSKYADLVYTGEQLDHIAILGKAVAFQSDIQ